MKIKSKVFEGASYFQHGHLERGKIEVCRFPDRERVALCITHGSTCQPLAYFRDDECAKAFMAWMDAIAEGAL